ncbi:unnamed protein product [Mytilus coruscus]|uniref:Uncharacterized protein n=1 Tax=Mytilus coruscus TaxID=42192 RepID=A0A6J8CC60_MYTCO|nr:unnamed protein product [Mytilus coruscus]
MLLDAYAVATTLPGNSQPNTFGIQCQVFNQVTLNSSARVTGTKSRTIFIFEHSPYQNQQIQNELEILKFELNDSNRMKNWEDQTHINFRECNEKYAEIDGLEQQIKQLQSDNFGLIKTIRDIKNNQNQMALQQQRNTNHRTFYTRNRQSQVFKIISLIDEEWIGNRNAKERRNNGKAKPTQKKAVIAGGTNALFEKTIKQGTMDGPTYMKHLSSEWGKLEDGDKIVFVEGAQKIIQDPYKGKPGDAVIS